MLPYNVLASHPCIVFRAVLGFLGGVLAAHWLPGSKMVILGDIFGLFDVMGKNGGRKDVNLVS